MLRGAGTTRVAATRTGRVRVTGARGGAVLGATNITFSSCNIGQSQEVLCGLGDAWAEVGEAGLRWAKAERRWAKAERSTHADRAMSLE